MPHTNHFIPHPNRNHGSGYSREWREQINRLLDCFGHHGPFEAAKPGPLNDEPFYFTYTIFLYLFSFYRCTLLLGAMHFCAQFFPQCARPPSVQMWKNKLNCRNEIRNDLRFVSRSCASVFFCPVFVPPIRFAYWIAFDYAFPLFCKTPLFIVMRWTARNC